MILRRFPSQSFINQKSKADNQLKRSETDWNPITKSQILVVFGQFTTDFGAIFGRNKVMISQFCIKWTEYRHQKLNFGSLCPIYRRSVQNEVAIGHKNELNFIPKSQI